MLTNAKAFQDIEEVLRNNGTLQRFEEENGKVLGRMMIDLGKPPSDLEIEISKGVYTFIGSFDFYDSEVGIAIDPVTRKAFSGIWITPQKEGAEQPADDWIKFFVKTLVDSFEEDGGFGHPICSFVNDSADMTVVPTKDGD